MTIKSYRTVNKMAEAQVRPGMNVEITLRRPLINPGLVSRLVYFALLRLPYMYLAVVFRSSKQLQAHLVSIIIAIPNISWDLLSVIK